jgi:hypothetical protein
MDTSTEERRVRSLAEVAFGEAAARAADHAERLSVLRPGFQCRRLLRRGRSEGTRLSVVRRPVVAVAMCVRLGPTGFA